MGGVLCSPATVARFSTRRDCVSNSSNQTVHAAPLAGRTVLVTGAGGQLGTFLLDVLARAGARPVGLGSRPGSGIAQVADITDEAAVSAAMRDVRPDIVIHGAAWTDVDGCEKDPARAHRVNDEGARIVAEAAADVGAWCLAVGTDFVFAGDGGAPYAEDAEPHPISQYGASKLAGERAVLATNGNFAVARTAWVWGGVGKHFPRTVVMVLRDRGGMTVVDDERGNPTHAGDLAEALAELAGHGGPGVYHLTNSGETSRFALAQAVARAAGFDETLVTPTTTVEFRTSYPLPAPRPADSSLANTRAAALGVTLRSWQSAVADQVPALARELGLDPDRAAHNGQGG